MNGSAPSAGAEGSAPAYAVITAFRDERENLVRLAACLEAQNHPPAEWILVDDGSRKPGEAAAASPLGRSIVVRVVRIESRSWSRGGQIARAIEAGVAALRSQAAIVVVCDADVSFDSDFFALLTSEFARDPHLGIASGQRLERLRGSWKERHVTGAAVQAQCRAYRRLLLETLMPLDRSMGWDGIDEAQAHLLGWRTRTFRSILFRHHRAIGAREPNRVRAYAELGAATHYMGYRPSYLALRALFRARRDPRALAEIWGYAVASIKGTPRFADADVRRYFRDRQSLLNLVLRAREALGKRPYQMSQAQLLLVADSGGHLLELTLLAERLESTDRVWVTQDRPDARSLLQGERTVFAHGPTTRSLPNLVRNVRLARRVALKTRPGVLLTTGAGLSVPFAWCTKIFAGTTIVYVEILGATRPSLSLRLVQPVADRVYVQWPELSTELPDAVYIEPAVAR